MQITIVAELSPQQIQEIAKEVARIITPKTETKIPDSDSLELMTVQEASKISGVSLQTIRRHIESKLLPAKKVGKSFKIKKSDFKEYING